MIDFRTTTNPSLQIASLVDMIRDSTSGGENTFLIKVLSCGVTLKVFTPCLIKCFLDMWSAWHDAYPLLDISEHTH